MLTSNTEHQSTNVSQARRKTNDEDGEDDEETEVLLPLFNPHLDEQPDDEADQQGLHQRKQPCSFTPINAEGFVESTTELDDGIANRVLFTVAKHVNAHHGRKTVAQLPEDHPKDHGVGEQGFV